MNFSFNEKKYNIVITACFPCCYKIVLVGNFKENNSSSEYFRSVNEAIDEIQRRGGKLGVIRT